MTTKQSIETLAASLYQMAINTDDRLYRNGGSDTSEFAQELADQARMNLHDFLTLHADVLDQDTATITGWLPTREASATQESWKYSRQLFSHI